MSTAEWEQLKCENCGAQHDLEFSTSDGAPAKSEILCLKCSNYWKRYVNQRGYMIDYDDFFGPLKCYECSNENPDELRLPKSTKVITQGANQVLCLDCIKQL